MAIDFKHLNPELYRHPGERAARAKLERIPGFARIAGMMASDNFSTGAERQAELASSARAGTGVYPALHALWTAVQARFGLSGIPLHIAHGQGTRAALRGGNDRPLVLLPSALLSSLPEREMEALLAMQAASVRLGNATLAAAADAARSFLDAYGVAGAPVVLPAWGLESWRRCALFSADRAAALALAPPDAVHALLDRLSGAGESAWGGVPRPEELRTQGLEAVALGRETGGWPGSGMLRRLALAMNRENGMALVRRADLADWFSSGIPAKILSGEIVHPDHLEGMPGAEPSVAYWGEFAGWDEAAEEEAKTGAAGVASQAASQAYGELKGSAEKGLSALFRAGEAFWSTLTENGGKK